MGRVEVEGSPAAKREDIDALGAAWPWAQVHEAAMVTEGLRARTRLEMVGVGGAEVVGAGEVAVDMDGPQCSRRRGRGDNRTHPV